MNSLSFPLKGYNGEREASDEDRSFSNDEGQSADEKSKFEKKRKREGGGEQKTFFLDASSHLYKPVCLSVGPSVGP